MMKRNWIVFAFALLALASCSVEKRVYQPGYHIEWNHFAKQDAEQDASRDVAQDVAQDATQDATQDVAQDVAQDASQDASRDLSENLSENLETDVAKDVSQDASRDLSENLSKNLETDVSQGFSKNLSENLSKNIDSGLELILLIILALFLPALTIFLVEGLSKNFWMALLLMVLAFAFPISLLGLKAIFEIIAVVLAIAVVLHYA